MTKEATETAGAAGMREIAVPVDNHTHAGKQIRKGETITVDEKSAAMLEKRWADRKA